MAGRTLEQTNGWDPLDLGAPDPKRRRTPRDAPGILPDTDTRPEIRPVQRPTSQPQAPRPSRADAPWDSFSAQ